MARVPLLVFSDLDGTLLDHDSYSHDAALPALAALSRIGAPLVLASSKTAPEIAALHRTLGLGDTPAIVENGAAVMVPGQPEQTTAYAALRAVLDDLPPALRAGFRGFGDMTDDEVARVTGLPASAAALARNRAHSEPGLWTGTDAARADFLRELAQRGVTAREGGRFLTLSRGGTKADRMAGITERYAPALTLALGDAPNDAEMIEAADRGVIVRNPHGPGVPSLPGETTGRIIRTTKTGPEGWNDAVLSVIADLNETRSGT
ncbi:HAD-IIB family hydrolase [Anianabacter salinae]|uniref:HAD-IIB family hydrolase n=1 Tax=Anianabacter salinae TaxID=2851023 RepID=UPI00225E63D3|nr:HAD-IIB family hydrolase [Anianabacter salinae]MBV0912393.1 HAD-IIB family hydrolase [Anianabacter salinae]